MIRVEEYLYSKLSEHLQDVGFDTERVKNGIHEFSEDNGFEALNGKYEDRIITKVLDDSIALLMEMPPEDTALYFSEYALLGRVKLLENRTLEIAKAKAEGKVVPAEDVANLEKELSEISSLIGEKPGVYEKVRNQMSEIVLNLDCASGQSNNMSLHMRD